jgi:hypothetical protein
MELEKLKNEENLKADSKRLNEFLNKNEKGLREKLDELHAKFFLKKCKEGNCMISDFQMVNEFLEYLKANL